MWLYMDICLDHCYVADIFIEVFRMLLLYMVVYGYMFRSLLCGCYIHRGFLEYCYCIWLYMDRCLDHCYVADIFIEVFRMLLLYMVVYGYMFRSLLCGCYIHRGF